MRKGDASVVFGEMGDLLPPREVIATEAMHKNDRRPRARDFIVDATSRPFEEAPLGAWHPCGL